RIPILEAEKERHRTRTAAAFQSRSVIRCTTATRPEWARFPSAHSPRRAARLYVHCPTSSLQTLDAAKENQTHRAASSLSHSEHSGTETCDQAPSTWPGADSPRSSRTARYLRLPSTQCPCCLSWTDPHPDPSVQKQLRCGHLTARSRAESVRACPSTRCRHPP